MMDTSNLVHLNVLVMLRGGALTWILGPVTITVQSQSYNKRLGRVESKRISAAFSIPSLSVLNAEKQKGLVLKIVWLA